MKKLICLSSALVLFPLFNFNALAEGKQKASPSSVFNPLQSKAENCGYLEGISAALSCEQNGGADCGSLKKPASFMGLPPLYGIYFQGASTFLCSFECVVGQEMCDERLNPNPDKTKFPFVFGAFSEYEDMKHPYSPSCAVGGMEEIIHVVEEDLGIEADEEGDEYRIIRKTYYYDYEGQESPVESVCVEYVEFLLVCDEEGKCDDVQKYTEEWRAHKERRKLQKYRDSCFIAKEEDCSRIAGEETRQCMGRVAGMMETALCSSGNPFWFYKMLEETGAFEIDLSVPSKQEEVKHVKPVREEVNDLMYLYKNP